MAKATAICTCKTCGAKFEKTAIKRNRSECDSWEAWAAETFDECPSCWGKRKREEERSTPVYAEVTVSPFDGKFNFILRGNTILLRIPRSRWASAGWRNPPPACSGCWI